MQNFNSLKFYKLLTKLYNKYSDNLKALNLRFFMLKQTFYPNTIKFIYKTKL